MKLEKFIDFVFDKIKIQFPNAYIGYELKENTGTHFFQVTPKSIHDKEAFIDLDYELSLLFRKNDYDGDFCIISENALTELNPSKTSYPESDYSSITTEFILEFMNLLDEDFKKQDTTLIDSKLDTLKLFGFTAPDTVVNSKSPRLSIYEGYEEERYNDHKSSGYQTLAKAA